MDIIDLYSGIGGGSEGFARAGYRPALACESDANARLVYANNYFVNLISDVNLLNAAETVHPEIIFAAPPTTDHFETVKQIILKLRPRAIMLEFPGRIVNKDKIAEKRKFEYAGYTCFHEILNSADFNLAQKRSVYYIVGFREDVKTPFISFPFPEHTIRGVDLSYVLEQNPDPKLLVSAEKMAKIYKQNEKNEENGTGFKTNIFTAKDISTSLPLSYYKDYRGILVDSGTGPRRLSVLECKRLMGFPDAFKMPISDTNAYRLLAQASCPSMVEAVAGEIRTWIEY